jgi:hypothetical protein
MQQVAGTLQLNLGFLFKKQQAFEKGHASSSALDAPLGDSILFLSGLKTISSFAELSRAS